MFMIKNYYIFLIVTLTLANLIIILILYIIKLDYPVLNNKFCKYFNIKINSYYNWSISLYCFFTIITFYVGFIDFTQYFTYSGYWCINNWGETSYTIFAFDGISILFLIIINILIFIVILVFKNNYYKFFYIKKVEKKKLHSIIFLDKKKDFKQNNYKYIKTINNYRFNSKHKYKQTLHSKIIQLSLVDYRFEIYVLKYLLIITIISLTLIIFFTTMDLLIFYVTFECAMLPLFFIIGIYGKQNQKIKASYYLFFFTVFSSIPLIIGILYFINVFGTTNLLYLTSKITLALETQLVLWFFFFLPFATKVPIVPLHTWLPEAHVEASTEGSVLIAGVVLKLGAYGILRIILPLFPDATAYYTPLIYIIAFVSLLYCSISIFIQSDLKKIVAYSSIAHMNVAILGIFSYGIKSLGGSVLLIFAHGVVSSGLFILVGYIYMRFHTRNIKYYSGLFESMPSFSTFFIIFSISNCAFPLTGPFISEVIILIGIISKNISIACLFILGSFLVTAYTFYIIVKMLYGTAYKPNFKKKKINYTNYNNFNKETYKFKQKKFYYAILTDITQFEKIILYILIFINFSIGIHTPIYLALIYSNCIIIV